MSKEIGKDILGTWKTVSIADQQIYMQVTWLCMYQVIISYINTIQITTMFKNICSWYNMTRLKKNNDETKFMPIGRKAQL